MSPVELQEQCLTRNLHQAVCVLFMHCWLIKFLMSCNTYWHAYVLRRCLEPVYLAETPIFWPPHAKSWLIGKDPEFHLCLKKKKKKKPWCWEGLGAGREGDDRGWDGWMASPTRWTWVWLNSGSWWWTGRPGVLQFMGSQRVRHDWVTEPNWIFHCVYVPQLSYPFIYR